MARRPRVSMHLQRLEDRTNPYNVALLDSSTYLPDSVLFSVAHGHGQEAVVEYLKQTGVAASAQPVGFGVYKMTLKPGVSVVTAVSGLQGHPLLGFIEPNFKIYKKAVANDPSFTDGTLWALRNTGQNGGTAGADTRAHLGWDIGVGSGETIVAVIDDGVQHTHPDLAANMWTNPGEVAGNGVDDDGNGFVDDIHGYDFTRNTGDILGGIIDDHGTHVAGTVGAVGNNAVGVTGVTWNTRIMTMPIFSSGAGNGLADSISALNYAVQMGSKLSNNSWGYQGPSSVGLMQAIAQAGDAGHVFVTAAGNTSDNNDVVDDFPTNYYGTLPNVVAVSAFDRNDRMASFSSYGLRKVTLGAPGVEIYSTSTGNGYAFKQGTSMASPQVAGALAAFMDASPGLTPAEVIAALKQSVRRIPAAVGKTDTGGVLDMNALMELSRVGLQVTGAGEGGSPHVKVFRGRGREAASFYAYDQRFTGGVRVATGDVTGDGFADVVTAAGPGGGPHVKVFDGKTFQEVFSFYAFDPTFSRGLTVAAGDVNGDGRADIIVGADAGGAPQVAVFGKLTPTGGLTRMADFLAYDQRFTGGVRVAAGVFTAGGKVADIVTGPGRGGGPHLRRFAGASVAAGAATVVAETFSGDPNDTSGLWVSAGDLNGDGVADIVAGVGAGTPVVRAFNGRNLAPLFSMVNPFSGEINGLVNPVSTTQIGSVGVPILSTGLIPPAASINSLAYEGNLVKPVTRSGYTHGVRVAVGDVNGDKKPDLILAGGPSDAPTIALIEGQSRATLGIYSAYDPAFNGGVFVGSVGV
jgi:subtilisin family serine protease